MKPFQLANMVLREGVHIHPASLVDKAAAFVNDEHNKAAEDSFMAELSARRAAKGLPKK
jgi:hypothetical protein